MTDKKIKTTEIEIRDFYGDKCLSDSFNRSGGGRGKPEGYVEIYEEDENGERKLIGRHNLVLYQGREQLAQRMMNFENLMVVSTKDEFVTWFGLGDGGVLPADPLDPIPPILTDTELYSLVMINATDSSSADYNIVDADHPEEGYYKHPFDSIEFEQDAMNDDKWLVIKITTVIGVDDANLYQLSEAGLYTAESSLGGPLNTGPFHLFSRVTFPSLIKTEDRRIIFRWFLYV
jgi:hypothetical protein